MADTVNRNQTLPEYYLDTDVKLHGSVLNPGFRQHLEAFYSKAHTSEHRARCLELLTALDISSAVKSNAKETVPTANCSSHVARQRQTRPFTAVGYYGDMTFDPYMTTHKREFRRLANDDVICSRPRSAHGAFFYPTAPSEKRTTYSDEFYEKTQPRTHPVRSGTASGVRCNKPHPLEAFMVWRFRREAADPAWKDANTAELDDAMDAALRGKLESTYRRDYLGLPLGCRPQRAASASDSKPEPTQSLDTTTRRTFQKPARVCVELEAPSTRFASGVLLTGSNRPALGTVPGTSNSIYLTMKGRTTYERHFTDPRGVVAVRDVRQMGRRCGAEALQKHLENMPSQPEKEDLTNILKCLEVNSAAILDQRDPSPFPLPPSSEPSHPKHSSRRLRIPHATEVCQPPHSECFRLATKVA